MIINCLNIANKIKEKLIKKILDIKSNYNINPKIAFVITSFNTNGNKFLNKKIQMANQLGILVDVYQDIKNKEQLISLIKTLNNDTSVHGIVVQLPIFDNNDNYQIFSNISFKKDVDGLNPISVGNHVLDYNYDLNIPCTVKSVIAILDSISDNYQSKNALIINRSNIVGKPLLQSLLNKDMTVTICNSFTKNIDNYIYNADVIISACNVNHIVNRNNVKKESILINVGTTYVDNKIKGDIDFDNLKDYVDYITPIVNGVGPLTVIFVFENLINLIEKFHLKK